MRGFVRIGVDSEVGGLSVATDKGYGEAFPAELPEFTSRLDRYMNDPQPRHS